MSFGSFSFADVMLACILGLLIICAIPSCGVGIG